MTIEYPPPDARLVDRVRIVRLSPARDVLHVASGGHRDECDIAAAAAPEIERLAALPALDYERERKQVASRLGIRVTELDRLARARRHADAAVTHGRAVMFAELEPWPGPVDGRELLDALSLNLRGRVVMADHAADTAALWVLHTHLLDCFDVSPRLAITSPEKACGKTTLLDVLAHLVSRPLFAANVTPAAVFRVIETHRPTLLIDEADTFLPENDELRGVLNSGHRRGGSVIRTVGDEHEPRAFATYAACAIALIGTLPGTLADRSVTIALRRRRPDEAIEAFRSDRTGPLDALARQAARWAADHADRVQETDPAMPAGVYNRVADNWRPLLAIADVAGGHWPQRARAALQCAIAAAGDDESARVTLLADIRAIFAARGTDRLTSAELVEALTAMEGRPWAEWRAARPITANGLARLLAPFGIGPATIRAGSATPRGYQRIHFEDAWQRYLPAAGFEPQHRNNADGPGISGGSATAT